MATCSVDACTAPVNSRGLCKRHYNRWRFGDTTITAGPTRRSQRSDQCSVPGCGARPAKAGLCIDHSNGGERTCQVADCSGPIRARNLCTRHYERFTRYGDPLGGPGRGKRPPPAWKGQPCSLDGCSRLAYTRGLCSLHYQRWQRLGDVGGAAPMVAPKGAGTTNGAGYREIVVDGRRRLEHRYVMEQVLGRPLERHENVHHKNGDRADNRPENLELWVTAQPSRQNVEDVVAWAREVLKRYEGDVKRLRRVRNRKQQT